MCFPFLSDAVPVMMPVQLWCRQRRDQDLNPRKVNMQPTNTPPPVSPEWIAEQWKIYKESK